MTEITDKVDSLIRQMCLSWLEATKHRHSCKVCHEMHDKHGFSGCNELVAADSAWAEAMCQLLRMYCPESHKKGAHFCPAGCKIYSTEVKR